MFRRFGDPFSTETTRDEIFFFDKQSVVDLLLLLLFWSNCLDSFFTLQHLSLFLFPHCSTKSVASFTLWLWFFPSFSIILSFPLLQRHINITILRKHILKTETLPIFFSRILSNWEKIQVRKFAKNSSTKYNDYVWHIKL